MSPPGYQNQMSSVSKSRHILVTGGARSGKSRFAENLAATIGGPVIYLATAEARDLEMAERIASHRRRRPPEWLTIEEPLEIIPVLRKQQEGSTVLLDCLTLYLSNLYFFKYEKHQPGLELENAVRKEIANLSATITESKANLIVVTNEVGWGIVPENEAARVFRDLAGIANQMVAEGCHEVYLVSCGIPVKLKGDL